ncbi:lysophospholipase L1-like esterase [Microbacterium resistens]|uniref:Lysophospholipase L1-like esterase n=1 Tax=Microbacterium resistens TaxID=156977 RepID=A0ABU1SDJ7_9MICO|nr:GDSL-type esterase/lipase family protein [Microbacterium resistens]MDR6867691.1 lysophospholipase L1-like esterase [Microbacterium resistens]
MVASVPVKADRLAVATPDSMALSIRNNTVATDAVDERIADVAADIIASDGTVIAAAAAAVEAELEEVAVVVGGSLSEEAATLTWAPKVDRWPLDDRFPADDRWPDVSTGASQSANVARLDADDRLPVPALPEGVVLVDESTGKIPESLLPDTSTETPISDGRPTYAPPTAGTFDAARGLWNFRPDQLLGWTGARAGDLAVLQIIGDSITRVIGSIQPGESVDVGAWPWLLLHRLGLPVAGRGIRFPNGGLINVNPGTTTNKVEEYTGGGFFGLGMLRIIDSGTQTAYCKLPSYTDVPEYEEIWVYGADIPGTSIVTVDGVPHTWAGSTSVTGADIPCLPGYPAGQRVGRLTVPRGAHDVRVHGTPDGVIIGGIEGRLASGLVVHQVGFSGKTLASFVQTTVGDLSGTSWGMVPRAHLVIDALGINDWQGGTDLAAFKANRLALWAAARAAGSDVICMITPRPDYTLYPPGGAQVPPHDLYLQATYEAALEADVPVIDIAYLWQSYTRAARFYGPGTDHIHPNSLGLKVIASIMATLLGDYTLAA